mmetsp:Transcript_45834/g.127166  ORF Transcript_45834/g.127166 Transcript_45834/m.127166 type:complete len:259 (+) Transcript_45834:260-1036(+)
MHEETAEQRNGEAPELRREGSDGNRLGAPRRREVLRREHEQKVEAGSLGGKLQTHERPTKRHLVFSRCCYQVQHCENSGGEQWHLHQVFPTSYCGQVRCEDGTENFHHVRLGEYPDGTVLWLRHHQRRLGVVQQAQCPRSGRKVQGIRHVDGLSVVLLRRHVVGEMRDKHRRHPELHRLLRRTREEHGQSKPHGHGGARGGLVFAASVLHGRPRKGAGYFDTLGRPRQGELLFVVHVDESDVALHAAAGHVQEAGRLK